MPAGAPPPPDGGRRRDTWIRLAALVAQNLSVEIRPGTDVQMLGVLNEYPVVPVAGGLQTQIGDAYAEERRRVVFELAVPKLATLSVVPVAEVVVRYVSLGEQLDGGNVVLRRVRADSRPLPGTRLVREYDGVQHMVTVRGDDFEFEGRPYRSLSAIARHITGTRWNGWTFFGLKGRPRA